MTTETPLVKLTNICKSYRTNALETLALDNICLKVSSGEFVAVMGPSGCGKSTLLNIVGLIDTPSRGEYRFADRNLSSLSKDQLARLRKGDVGFVFQSFNLIDDLNVYENVELPLIYKGIRRRQRINSVREALELVGLSARSKFKPEQLSSGQQQRVAVARAVVGDPRLILADEPTGNLDSKAGETIMSMLNTLNDQGATVLMVTHSTVHAERAHRVVRMMDGRITLDST